MYLLQYCALTGNGWNDWHINTILGFVETIEQGKEYARQLIANGIKPYSVVRHSYTNDRLTGGGYNLMKVQSIDTNLCPTLDTRCDCLAVVVIEGDRNGNKNQK